MATDSSSGTLPSSSRLTMDSSSSMARSNESFFTSVLVSSTIISFPARRDSVPRIVASWQPCERGRASTTHQGGHMGGGGVRQALQVVSAFKQGDDAPLGGFFGDLHQLSCRPFEIGFHKVEVGERIARMG